MPAFTPINKPITVASDELGAALLVFVPTQLILVAVILVPLVEDVVVEDVPYITPTLRFGPAHPCTYHRSYCRKFGVEL